MAFQPENEETNSDVLVISSDNEHSGSRADTEKPQPTPFDALLFIQQLAEGLQIDVLYNGKMLVRGQKYRATSTDEFEEVLKADQMDQVILLDRAILVNKVLGYNYRNAELRAAVQEFMRRRKRERKAAIVLPLLLRPLTDQEKQQAKLEWEKVARLFDMAACLVLACLQHFIWQIYRKAIGRSVVHHLMPVIVSREQGAGKSRFVECFIAPMQELAPAPIRTSEILDERSIALMTYPILVLDDMEKPKAIENLKSFMTNDEQLRRVLRTSMDVTVKQEATLIGTSNNPVSRLIPDDSGNRRFAEMPFRNGNVVKGGDPEIWPTINSVNMELLWRSVNPLAESPIIPYLGELALHQNGMGIDTALLSWLNSIDANSEEIVGITTVYGVKAGELHKLYQRQTGIQISAKNFSTEMDELIGQGKGPFAQKRRDPSKSFYYVFRASG
jgi:hypothetical protein